MCNNHNHHHTRVSRCVIPPYISDKLIESSDKEVALRAINSERQTIALRSSRKFISNLETMAKRSLFGHLTPAPAAMLKMQVYDIKHSTDASAAMLVWDNGTTLAKLDKDAKNVIKAGTATWDFYYALFGRNSIDSLGMALKHYVHYGNLIDDIDNAMWDGVEMVYGDGDGQIFGSFTADPDIIGHELTHGVTQFESNLEYHNQSGALNESLSDVFGIMIKQRINNEDVIKSNWLIGENVLLGNDYALRSMAAPGTAYKNHPFLKNDPQPATMDKFVTLPDTRNGDYGGVHYNSGIPNFAFYSAAREIGGFAWEKAGRIWYEAMTDSRLGVKSNFADFKALTIEKAETIFGIGSNEAAAVKKGWDAAKV